MRNRDSQRSKVYGAEHACTWTEWQQTIPNDQLQYWLDKNILSRAWFRRRWGNRRVTVELGKGGGLAYTSRFTVGVQARNPWVFCHEMAHILTKGAAHGPEFTRVYLFLVEKVIGKAEAMELRQKFRAKRVKVASPSVIPAPSLDLSTLPPFQVTKPKAKAKRPSAPTLAAVKAAARKIGATVDHEAHGRGHWSLEVTAPEGAAWEREGFDVVDLDDDQRVLSTYAYPESAFGSADRYGEILWAMEQGLRLQEPAK